MAIHASDMENENNFSAIDIDDMANDGMDMHKYVFFMAKSKDFIVLLFFVMAID